MVGRRLVRKAEHRLLDRFVVELAGGLDLAGEQRLVPTFREDPEVTSVRLPVDSEKAANDGASQPAAVREHGHGPVAVGQAPVVEAVEQGSEAGDITQLSAQGIQTDLIVENGAHPLERGRAGLLAPARFRGDAGDPTGIADELLDAAF